jgi:pilus assembly protein CpaF
MISSALNLIILQTRLRDGSRKVVKIAEVTGMQGDTIKLQDIFEFRQRGIENGKIMGYLTGTGQIPQCLSRIQAANIDLPLSIFTPHQG